MSDITKTPSSITLSKKRIEWIDITKGLAIFFVALGHVLYKGNLDIYIYSFHMPLFFMLSGMTFHVRHDEKYGTFFWKKFKSLMIPYYLFGVISIIIYCLLGNIASKTLSDVTNTGTNDFSFLCNLLNLLYGSDMGGALKFNTALWFLTCLFTMENIAYFLCLFNRLIAKSFHFTFFLVFLFLFLALDQGNKFYFHIYDLPMELHAAIRLLPYFLFGMLWQNHLTDAVLDFKRRLLYAFTALVFISSGVILCFYIPFTFLRQATLAFISGIGYIYLCRSIHRCSMLSYCGRNTLVILVLHKFPILFFQTILPWTILPLKNNHLGVAVLVSILSIVMCLVCGYFINIYCPWVLGRFKGKNRSENVIAESSK